MAALLPKEKLCRPKFASIDYWETLVSFLGHPRHYDSTKFEAKHLVWKEVGASLTNGHNVEAQVMNHATTLLSFDCEIPIISSANVSERIITENKQLLVRDRKHKIEVGWINCGDEGVPQDAEHTLYNKARYNGFIVKPGQFLTLSGNDLLQQVPPGEDHIYKFLGIYTKDTRPVGQGKPVRSYLLWFQPYKCGQVYGERSKVKSLTELREKTLISTGIQATELLDVSNIKDKLYLQPYVRYPYRYIRGNK
jgi:hypothetical protein